jgi:hypothetical protein
MKDLYSYSLTSEQYLGIVRRAPLRTAERIHTRGLVALALLLALASLAVVAVQMLGDGALLEPAVPVPALLAFAVVCVALAAFARYHGILLLHRRSAFYPGRRQLGVDDDGLWIQGPHGESFTRWSGWSGIEEHGGMVLLWNDEVHAQAIPFSAFESEQQRRAFVAQVRARL